MFMTRVKVLAGIALALGAAALVRAGSFSADFGKDKWQAEPWTQVKSPRWDRMGGWIQRQECIENETPAKAKPAELVGKCAAETYSSMVLKERFSGDVTVRATLSFEDQMAPLIVIAPELGQDDQGRPEYREHFEIVLYEKGVNVWHHQWAAGKPSWKKAAYWRFAADPKVKHEVTVRLHPTSRGKMLIVKVDDREMGYMDDTLPDECYVGITGCEGVNRFYQFHVRSK